MYYAEDYIDFIKETELLVKEVKEFETDNQELRSIMSFIRSLANNQVVLANSIALQAGVDASDY